MVRSHFSRWIGIFAAAILGISAIWWMPYYPICSPTYIGICFLVIYGLVDHGSTSALSAPGAERSHYRAGSHGTSFRTKGPRSMEASVSGRPIEALLYSSSASPVIRSALAAALRLGTRRAASLALLLFLDWSLRA